MDKERVIQAKKEMEKELEKYRLEEGMQKIKEGIEDNKHKPVTQMMRDKNK